MTNLRTFGAKARVVKTACILSVFCLAVALTSSAATTVTTLVSFDGTNGSQPEFGSLVQGTNGNFYGTTWSGGANIAGTVFKITPAGKLTTLYSFCAQAGCNGYSPDAGLVQATNGNFYGTTGLGGAHNYGTVFEITPAGKLTTLYSFCAQSGCTDGQSPDAGLVQATNGNFYGTTLNGGAIGAGTVFEITPAGKLTTLHSFCSQTSCGDGGASQGGLVQATNGNFYGTTSGGGANGGGTVFEITPAGKLTTLYSFCAQSGCADGSEPSAGLVRATNGNFYGTTTYGGADGKGTVFEITPAGKLTTLHSFCSQISCGDGDGAFGTLVQATNGNFYGTTVAGGANSSGCGGYGCGTVFQITPAGKLTTLYSFCAQSGCADGSEPSVGLVEATNGNFYGTTTYGGANSSGCGGYGCGTVFSLSVGLGPFVETRPTSGKVGAAVIILGTNVTGATGVSFHGTAAKFEVVSKSEIKTTVPSGATTGYVTVTTAKGTLKSNVKFRVIP